MKWKSDIQVAIGEEEMCSKLLKKYIRNFGFLFTKNIVGEEWAIMGSTFLDQPAKMRQLQKRESGSGDVGEGAADKHEGKCKLFFYLF